MSSTITSQTMSDAALDALADTAHGRVLRPDDRGFEEHRRVWNGAVDRTPALIVRCADVADVTAAVSFAQDHGLLTAVRGGGHSFPGFSTCDGGIVIDLSPLTGCLR